MRSHSQKPELKDFMPLRAREQVRARAHLHCGSRKRTKTAKRKALHSPSAPRPAAQSAKREALHSALRPPAHANFAKPRARSPKRECAGTNAIRSHNTLKAGLKGTTQAALTAGANAIMRRRKCDNAQVANSTGASGVSSVFGLGKLAVKFPELRVLVSGFTFGRDKHSTGASMVALEVASSWLRSATLQRMHCSSALTCIAKCSR